MARRFPYPQRLALTLATTMPNTRKVIAVADGPAEGFPGVVRAGPLLFVSGCEGHRDRTTGRILPELAAEAEAQCENAYGRIADLLARAGSSMDRVVRLDHFTSSQDWLARRQSVRGRIWGKPAPLASTGVAAKMSGLNMLTASVIAVVDAADKQVLVDGPRYAMENIAAAVRGGPFVFVSGIRGTVDPRSGDRVAEETPEAFRLQTDVSCQTVRSILGECELTPDALLRVDTFLRDGARASEAAAIHRRALGSAPVASTTVALPLSARGEIEITALAAAKGVAKRVHAGAEGEPVAVTAAGLVFVGECLGLPGDRSAERSALAGDAPAQLERALGLLERALQRAGTTLADLVRIEVYVRDIYKSPSLAPLLRQRLRESPPTLIIAGAELDDCVEVKLNAIAVAA